jgi:hypothetical protein
MANPFADFRLVDGKRISSGVSLRDDVAQSREQKRLAEEANYTFHPVVPVRHHPDIISLKTTVRERFENLHTNRSKRTTRNIGTEEQFTFSPTISAKAKSLSSSRKSSEFVELMHNSTGSGSKLPIKNENVNSFSPKINKRVGGDEKSTGVQTSERLHAQQSVQKAKLDKIREAQKLEDEKECTFSPAVSPKTKSLSASPDSKPVSDRLVQYGIEKAKKREAMILAQAQKESQNYTFQPSLSTPRKLNTTMTSLSSESDSQTGSRCKYSPAKSPLEIENRFDNLYNDAKKRQSDDLRKLTESECTFTPQISAHARRLPSYKSTAEHVAEMHNAFGSGRPIPVTPVQETHTFIPSISKLGSSMDRSNGGDVTDHLYACKDAQEHRIEVLKYEAAVKVLGDCTFTPQISDKSKALTPPTAVVDRLLDYGEEKIRKMKEGQIQKAKNEMADVTFQPFILKSPRAPDDYTESGTQFDRLYSDALKRQVEDPYVRAKFEEMNLSFIPEISDLAKGMDRTRVDDINLRQKEQNARRRDEEIALRLQEATFSHTPTISRRASSIDRAELEEMAHQQRERNERRKEDVAHDMSREYTFSPKMPSSSSTQHKRRVPSGDVSLTQYSENQVSDSGSTSDEQTSSPIDCEYPNGTAADHKAVPVSPDHLSPESATTTNRELHNDPKVLLHGGQQAQRARE